MIFGVGTDVVEIARVHRALERWGERFARKILTEPELARFRNHRLPAHYLAKRFAAKEAFTKALGTGIRSPAGWHGMWVVNQPSGKPELRYTPKLEALLKGRGITSSHLSLSDEKGVAFATVILECAR